jgi:hypothetical protein
LLELRHQLLHRIFVLAQGQHDPEVQGDRAAQRDARRNAAVKVNFVGKFYFSGNNLNQPFAVKSCDRQSCFSSVDLC